MVLQFQSQAVIIFVLGKVAKPLREVVGEKRLHVAVEEAICVEHEVGG